MTTNDAFKILARQVGWAKHWRAFARFHQANPHVFDYFEQFSFEIAQAGHQCYGAHAIVQRIRWEFAITTKKTDEFKISNCHFPFYSRLFTTKYPHLATLFVRRALH